MQDGLDEVLGLGTRDERGRSDFQIKAEELLLASDVLNRLVLKAAINGSPICGELFRREAAVGVSEKRCAVDAENVQKQQFGIAMSLIAEMWIGGKRCGGVCQSLAEDHRME